MIALAEWWNSGVVTCLGRGADLHMAQLMPLPVTVFCSSKSRLVFTFLVQAYPGCPRRSPGGCNMVVVVVDFCFNSQMLKCDFVHLLP